MNQSLHQALSAAVLRMLRPLAGVLLRHGMAYGTFAELARKAYVDEAFEQTIASGQRPTVSGVSAITGLTRKETKRLHEQENIDDDASSQRYNRAIRVISGWTSDARFHTASGEPAILPVDGEQGSFSALVKEFSGDIPVAAMLSVLERSGTVVVNNTGVNLLHRAYVPSSAPIERVAILGSDPAELISTIGHNLVANPEQRHFQRKVSNVLVHPDALPAFREMSNRKSQELLEEYHAWLSAHEIQDIDDEAAPPAYVSVGIYYHENLGTEED